MDIKNVLLYLKEELKDIPAKPDNIHYTNLYGLYNILQNGLEGKKGGYDIKSDKTKDDDMELATVRNTRKLTPSERFDLSENASGGIKIELFTDRILAAHRGTTKIKIAEIPLYIQKELKKDEESFKEDYGFEMPKLFTPNKSNFKTYHLFDLKHKDYLLIQNWLEENAPRYKKDESIIDRIYNYNRGLSRYYKKSIEREREERFILKQSIPVDPKFMRITFDKFVTDFYEDGDLEELDESGIDKEHFLRLIDSHEKAFTKSDSYYDFRKYLKSGEVE